MTLVVLLFAYLLGSIPSVFGLAKLFIKRIFASLEAVTLVQRIHFVC